MARSNDTRQRLLHAGMKLFAQNGFAGTSIGDIEEAVGLQPRRGALYKHFRNKQDLLETAVRQQLDDAAATAKELEAVGLANAAATQREELRPLILAIARRFLTEMDRLEDLTRLIEHDGSRLDGLIAEVKSHAVDLSYIAAGRLVAGLAPSGTDADATAVVLLGSLVALRRTTWTFGSPPIAIRDDRFLEAWADTALAALGVRAAPSPDTVGPRGPG